MEIIDAKSVCIKWKKYIMDKLNYNCGLFVEIEMNGETTKITDELKFIKIDYIYKNTLLKLIKNLFDEMNIQYIVSTRSAGNSSRYFIVVSPIQNSI